MHPSSTAFLLLVPMALGVSDGARAQTPALLSASSRFSVTAAGDSTLPVLSGDGRAIVFLSTADNLATNDKNRGHADVFFQILDTSLTRLVSVNTNGVSGNGTCSQPGISREGRFVVFVSTSDDLVSGDTNGVADVFVRDLEAGTTALVSTTTTGFSDGESAYATMTPDGRFVVFETRAPSLAGGDTNRNWDVYLRDLVTGTTRWITPPATNSSLRGLPGGDSVAPAISEDGATIAFESAGLNLAPGIQAGAALVTNNAYVLRPPARTNRMVDVMSESLDASLPVTSSGLSLSADGRWLALLRSSADTNLVGTGVYRVDLDSGGFERLDDGVAGVPPTAPNGYLGPFISADGRTVIFETEQATAMGLTPSGTVVHAWDEGRGASARVSSAGWIQGSDSSAHEEPWGVLLGANRDATFVAFLGGSTNDPPDSIPNQIVVRHLPTGELRRISRTASGTPTRDNEFASVSFCDDGRRLAFQSREGSLTAGDLNGAWDIFVYDWDLDVVRLVSGHAPDLLSVTGFGSAGSGRGAWSADARRLVLSTTAPEWTLGDTNGAADVYLEDLQTGSNQLVSVNRHGTAPGDGASRESSVSANGRYVAFTSFASDLIESDTNGVDDVFLRDVEKGTTVLVSHRPDGSSPSGASRRSVISPDGRWIAFESLSGEFGADDGNLVADIYLFDAASDTIRLVSHNANQTGAGNGTSGHPSFSPDGSWLVFETQAGDLKPGLAATGRWVYASNLDSGELRRLSPVDAEPLGFYPGPDPVAAFSPDGRHVAFTQTLPGRVHGGNLCLHDFESRESSFLASNAVVTSVSKGALRIGYQQMPESTNGFPQARILDRLQETNLLVSADLAGNEANGPSGGPLLGGNGRFAVFSSAATNLVAGDENGRSDLFVKDLLDGWTLRIGGDSLSVDPVIAADDQTVVFHSFSGDLVDGDFNQDGDLYLIRLPGPESGFRVTSIAKLTTGEVRILWPTSLGKTYRVQATMNPEGDWLDLPLEITMSRGQASAVDAEAIGLPLRLYRVIEQ